MESSLIVEYLKVQEKSSFLEMYLKHQERRWFLTCDVLNESKMKIFFPRKSGKVNLYYALAEFHSDSVLFV